jgi:hypothetical protein
VHVIAPGKGHDRVDFDAGVWVHRIVAAHRARPPEAARLGIPTDLWNRSASMLDELDRIGAHRRVSVVAGSLSGEAIAALLSGRYRVATCLGNVPATPSLLEACLLERGQVIPTEGRNAGEVLVLLRQGPEQGAGGPNDIVER